MRLLIVGMICAVFLTACASNELSVINPSPPQSPLDETSNPVKDEPTTIVPKLINEGDFTDEQLKWIKMINQDITAINEQDVQTAADLRGVKPDPSILITSLIQSVQFIKAEESTTDKGAIRVDYRFNDAPSEPQYALYTFQKNGDSWIITDVSIDVTYKPGPTEQITPRFINESDYSGEQLEWVKLINQDIKAIAEGDEAAFDSLRRSKQSLPADIPPLPFVSIELVEIDGHTESTARLIVDRRVWGNEDDETFISYVLAKENGTWIIIDVD